MTEEDNRMLAMRGAMLEALKKAGEKGDAVQESQKLDENKLIYRAEKLGKGWSNWINSASLKSWRELDPKIVNDWTTLAVQISGIEQDSSNRAIARIAKGMGLQGDKLVKAGASNHNKIAFLYDGFKTSNSRFGNNAPSNRNCCCTIGKLFSGLFGSSIGA